MRKEAKAEAEEGKVTRGEERMRIPHIPSSSPFSSSLLLLSARNIFPTYCDQRGGTNRINTFRHTHAQDKRQRVKQGSSPKVINESDHTEQNRHQKTESLA